MSENPYAGPMEAETAPKEQPLCASSDRAAYNVVTDTVIGVNVRWSDNKFQAIFVFVSTVLISLIGAILAAVNAEWNLPWYGGALIGSFAGLVIGIFASGLFLMFYRAARHIRGKHD